MIQWQLTVSHPGVVGFDSGVPQHGIATVANGDIDRCVGHRMSIGAVQGQDPPAQRLAGLVHAAIAAQVERDGFGHGDGLGDDALAVFRLRGNDQLVSTRGDIARDPEPRDQSPVGPGRAAAQYPAGNPFLGLFDPALR